MLRKPVLALAIVASFVFVDRLVLAQTTPAIPSGGSTQRSVIEEPRHGTWISSLRGLDRARLVRWWSAARHLAPDVASRVFAARSRARR